MKSPVVLSITQLNTYIKSILDGDTNLVNVFVSGEISNFTNHYKSGHLYLSLKDENCVIKAVMFAPNARRLRFAPQDGLRVLVRGRVSVYEQSGQYQLYIEDMQPDGLGALNLAFEQLKEKLSAEGLFRLERKKPLPKFPERIGVITSQTGAVVHDIQQILQRRYPIAQIILCPVLVQGENAAPQIVSAIEKLNQLQSVDVIIVGRGGGSLEDLWPFNEEIVARAVSKSAIPIISAVGHETDFTICDFVADLRAPTPSAAAELVVPNAEELKQMLASYSTIMQKTLEQKINLLNQQLDTLNINRAFQLQNKQIISKQTELNHLTNRLIHCLDKLLSENNARLALLSEKLNSLSPLQVLSRGYSIAYRQDGKILKCVKDVKVGDSVNFQLNDGELSCTVNKLRYLKKEEQ